MSRPQSDVEVLVHIVWSTYGRASMLAPDVDAWIQNCVDAEARHLRCPVIAVGNASDHVHVLARVVPSVPLAELVRRMKGSSSFHAKQAHRIDLYWQDGYWARSVSPASIDDLVRYIRDQRAHHATATASEPWESIVSGG